MINLIYFSFVFASYPTDNKIERWDDGVNYFHYSVDAAIDNVTASDLAIDENGQRLYWINNGSNRRYILTVYF